MSQLSPQQAAKEIGTQIKQEGQEKQDAIRKSHSTGNLAKRLKESIRVLTR